jgi:hypothetical protein
VFPVRYELNIYILVRINRIPRVVVTLIKANVPTAEFQTLWSSLIGSLRLEYENTIQHPDTDALMECVRRVLITHEAKWPLGFIGGKYDCAGEGQQKS